MTDEAQNRLENECTRGEDAKILLRHPLLQEAFAAAEKSVLAQMDEVSMRDTDMHTRLILARKVAKSVIRYIENIIETGKFADLQLEERRRLKDVFR